MNRITRRTLVGHAAAIGATGLAASPAMAAIKYAKPPAAVGKLPARSEFVIRGAYVMTMDPATGDIAGGDVHVKDGVIVAVGKGIKAPGAAVFSGERMIVL